MTVVRRELPPSKSASRPDGLQGPLQGGVVELLSAKPGPMSLCPVLAGEVAVPVALEQLDHAMSPAQDVPPDGLAAAQKIAHPFLGLIGDVDGGQLARAKQPDEFSRIALVGFDALTRAPGSRLGALSFQPRDQAPQRLGLVRNLAQLGV